MLLFTDKSFSLFRANKADAHHTHVNKPWPLSMLTWTIQSPSARWTEICSLQIGDHCLIILSRRHVCLLTYNSRCDQIVSSGVSDRMNCISMNHFKHFPSVLLNFIFSLLSILGSNWVLKWIRKIEILDYGDDGRDIKQMLRSLTVNALNEHNLHRPSKCTSKRLEEVFRMSWTKIA